MMDNNSFCPNTRGIFIIKDGVLLSCSKNVHDYVDCFGEQWMTVDYDPEFFTEEKMLMYDIVVPDNITRIDDFAFANCENINSITIPRSVKHIGSSAFSNCGSGVMTKITIEGKDVSFEPDTFNDSFFYYLHLSSLDENEDKEKVEMIRRLLPDDTYPYFVFKPDYLFFDTETNGLPLDYSAPSTNLNNWPRLVQLSWIVADAAGTTCKVSNHIIRPDGFTIGSSQRVHGITQKKAMEEGDDLRTVLQEFVKDINTTRMIVGHNVEFDMKVVGAELLRNGYSDIFEGKLFFCTMKNTIDYCCLPGGIKGLKYPKLQELHSILFGKEYDNAHNSLDDVYATKSCYFKLLKRNLIPKERFDGLQYSPEGWVPVETRPFTSNEIESVSEALIVASQKGKTVQFTMKRGGIMFIPLKPGSLIGVGEVLNLNEAKLEVLKRDDGETSYRVIVRPSLES